MPANAPRQRHPGNPMPATSAVAVPGAHRPPAGATVPGPGNPPLPGHRPGCGCPCPRLPGTPTSGARCGRPAHPWQAADVLGRQCQRRIRHINPLRPGRDGARHPPGPGSWEPWRTRSSRWVVQQAWNLLTDPEDAGMSVKFVLHDRDGTPASPPRSTRSSGPISRASTEPARGQIGHKKRPGVT